MKLPLLDFPTEYASETPRLTALRERVEPLLRGLPPSVCYHTFDHTFEPRYGVVDLCRMLAYHEGLDEISARNVVAGAMLHDTGYALERTAEGHEQRGVILSEPFLYELGFTMPEVHDIHSYMLSTQLSVDPSSLPEKIIKDADTSNLGGSDDFFWDCNERVRKELSLPKGLSWLHSTSRLLEQHCFHTSTARKLWSANKLNNQASVFERVANLHA